MKTKSIVSSLLIAGVMAASSPAVHASDEVAGALIGAGAGAVVGHAVGGRDAAVIGGLLGAILGAAIADDDDRPAAHRPPPHFGYGPPPVRARYTPPPRCNGPRDAYPGWQGDREARHERSRDRDRDGWRDQARDRDRIGWQQDGGWRPGGPNSCRNG